MGRPSPGINQRGSREKRLFLHWRADIRHGFSVDEKQRLFKGENFRSRGGPDIDSFSAVGAGRVLAGFPGRITVEKSRPGSDSGRTSNIASQFAGAVTR